MGAATPLLAPRLCRARWHRVLMLIEGGLQIVCLAALAWALFVGWRSPSAVLAVSALAFGFYGLQRPPHSRLVAGMGMAAMLAAALIFFPLQAGGPDAAFYGASRLFQGMGVGWLLGVALRAITGERLEERDVGLALVFYTASLLLMGIVAQRGWGIYWSWDPLECWSLVPWLCAALVILLGSVGGRRRTTWQKAAGVLAAIVGFVVMLGAEPLLQALALASRYF